METSPRLPLVHNWGDSLRFVSPVLIFVTAWATYLWGSSPSLYGGDSGELITSAVVLGVSHAPGYPFHALLGKLGTALVPWGNLAYRVNLSSVFLTSLTVMGLFLFLRNRLTRNGPALFAAVLYGALPIVWDQAQIAEVFALNNVMALALLALFAKAMTGVEGTWSSQSERYFRAWAFVYGLGLANHQTLLFLAPGFMVLLAQRIWKRDVSIRENLGHFMGFVTKRFAGWMIFLILGLSLYIYLPIRAAQHPPVNFGDPHTWQRFMDVITRKEFGSLELHPAAIPYRNLGILWDQGKAFALQNAHQLGWVALGMALVGLWIGLRSLLIFWIFAGPFFFLFSNLSPFNTLAQWRMERFLLLPSLFLALGLGYFLQRVFTKKSLWMGIVVIVVAAEQVFGIHRPWFRWNTAFRDFGRNLSASLAPQSLFLIDRVIFDEPTSSLMVYKLVERKRPDLRVIYRPGTLFELFYGEDVLEIPRNQRMLRQNQRETELWRTLDRPLGVLAFVRENLPDFHFSLKGLLYQKEGTPGDPTPLYIRRDLGEPRPKDYPTSMILVHYPYFRTKAAFEAGDFDMAGKYARRAGWMGEEMEWLQSNLGSLWSQWGSGQKEGGPQKALEEARDAFEKTVSIDPFFPQGRYGMGYVHLQMNRPLLATGELEEAVRLRSEWSEAYYMLGLSYHRAGQNSQARKAWQQFLHLDPHSPLANTVRQNLGVSK